MSRLFLFDPEFCVVALNINDRIIIWLDNERLYNV